MKKMTAGSSSCFLLAGVALVALATSSPADDQPGPIAQKLQPFVDSNTLAGAVCAVASKDAVLDEEAVGYADVEAKKRMETKDLFWIASQSKAMTCAVLMMLVDEGRVSIDDPVEKYLPEFTGQKVKVGGQLVDPVHPILIRDVMTHTSGLPFASPMETPTLDGSSLAERVRSYAQLPLNTQPGTKFNYANAGINTVGRIIEVVSGEPYEQFMQERLFQPLGMTDTTFFPNDEQLTRLADSYQATPDGKGLHQINIGQLSYPLNSSHRYPMPAGGLFSTADDVVKFCQMILNDGDYQGTRYLSHKSIELMTTDQIPPSTGGAYGFGWMFAPGNFYHEGAFNTRMTIEPDPGIVEVFLVQQAGPWPNGNPDLKGIFLNAAHEIARDKQ